MRLVISPGRASKLRSFTARTPPKLTESCRTDRARPALPASRKAVTSRKSWGVRGGGGFSTHWPDEAGKAAGRQPQHEEHQHADEQEAIFRQPRQRFRQQ